MQQHVLSKLGVDCTARSEHRECIQHGQEHKNIMTSTKDMKHMGLVKGDLRNTMSFYQ